MTASTTAKLRKRAEFAEGVAIGMGFLLLKLQSQFGDQMGVGMSEQVQQAIGHYRRLHTAREARRHAAREARRHAADLNTETAARSD